MKKLLITLFFGLVLGAQAQNAENGSESTVDPLQLLHEVRKDLTGLEAAFVQYELTDDNQKVDPNSGRVWMQSPNQFRWHYIDPIEQLIVADGQKVWVYDEDLEQVTVKVQNNQLNPIYVIINDDESQQHYHIKHEIQSQGLDWISLTPKVDNEEVKTVWLAIENSVVKQIKVVNNFSQTMVFEFSDIKKNPGFNAGMFEFIPPQGVDVVQAIADETTTQF